jgi:hypothetical protein
MEHTLPEMPKSVLALSGTALSDGDLIKYGFKRQRIWSKKQENFTLEYVIEGYDGIIRIIPTFNCPGCSSPDYQVDHQSGIDYLLEHCQSPYGVYGDDFHIVSIDTLLEFIMLMASLKIMPPSTPSEYRQYFD